MIPALAGSGFMSRWAGKTGQDLLDRTRTTMPSGSAGSLSAQTYQDVVAYILQTNEIRSGRGELNEDTLKNVDIKK